MIRCFIRVLLRKCQLFHRFTIPAIQSAKIEYFAPKTNNGTQPKLNAACFVVQSCLADADFVAFSNYCLISTRLRARFFAYRLMQGAASSNAQGFQNCHSEERSDVGISQYPAASWESDRQNRNCLPEIATGAKRPRNDKLGGHHHFNDGLCWSTVLRRTRLSAPLQGAAGSLAKLSTFHFLFSTRRMPSPYNAPSMPPPFPSASSHTCFASSTARGRRIIPVRPNRR